MSHRPHRSQAAIPETAEEEEGEPRKMSQEKSPAGGPTLCEGVRENMEIVVKIMSKCKNAFAKM